MIYYLILLTRTYKIGQSVLNLKLRVSYKLLLSIHLYLFKGYYMYIEASSPHQPGDGAKLYSPPLKFFGFMCLEFYYCMSGAANGSLNVSINETVVFSTSGDKGNIWHKASINISSIVGLHWVSINETTSIGIKTVWKQFSLNAVGKNDFKRHKAGIFDNLLRIFESLNSTNLTLDGLSVFISKTSKTIILHLIINYKLNTYKM